MKQILVDTILMSEKRKNIIMLLYDKGKMNIDEIKIALNVNSRAVMPQIKKLIGLNFIIQEKDAYELSDIGKIIVEKMQDLLNISSIFEENPDYWKNRDLSKIPEHLLKRIGELGHCSLLEHDRYHLFEYHPVFIEEIFESNYLMMVSSSFQPQTLSILCDAAEKGMDISYIITKPLLERLIEDCQIDLEKYLTYDNTELLIDHEDDDIGLLTLAVSDKFITIWLFDKKHKFNRTTLISYNESALQWGKELFVYYKDLAKPFDMHNRKYSFTHESNHIMQNMGNSFS
ncbi:winged helix-turn-helix domain-containing protein [Methanolobus sp. ZRKC3]|uniref:helix-turn-helix transcriptional regulator n=1 Tax=Methanolobus sp. ZRKC3 TaxID=3125786 RepID=UPI003243A587